jgi:DNA-binding NarL/FixJ family response regulator
MVLLQESLKRYRDLGNSKGVALLLLTFARRSFERGDYNMAQTYGKESLTVFIERDSRLAIVGGLEILGKTAMAQGQYERAALLLATATTVYSEVDQSKTATSESSYEQIKAAIQAQLGKRVFKALWKKGCTMTPRQAFNTSPLKSAQGATVKTEHPQTPALLTAREMEVLNLMTRGFTNPQIARRLTISPVTVNAHVRSIYNKLEVNSRSEATRYALEHHLA